MSHRVEMTSDEYLSIHQVETLSDDTLPKHQVETLSDEYLPKHQVETTSDEYLSLQQEETTSDEYLSLHQVEDNINSSKGQADEFQGLRSIKRNGVFHCPWIEFDRPSLMNLASWKLTEPNNSNIPRSYKIDKDLPIKPLEVAKVNNPPADKVQVTWIGHATVLVQFDGITILADPVFSEYCGPRQLPGFGYKRYRSASCNVVEDLPKLDVVIISNNHYDHLDTGSVKDLNKIFPELQWYVALATRDWFIGNGCKNVTELDWWKEESLAISGKQFRFICTPAQHWCQRAAFDMNKVLSMVQLGSKRTYKKLLLRREKYGPFDLAAIPIGAYEPRYITEYQHVEPKESVQIHIDVQSKLSVGIHWGTFELTNEYYLEPAQKTEVEMINAGLDPSTFISLCHGETWTVGEHRQQSPFMSKYSDCWFEKQPYYTNMMADPSTKNKKGQ